MTYLKGHYLQLKANDIVDRLERKKIVNRETNKNNSFANVIK